MAACSNMHDRPELYCYCVEEDERGFPRRKQNAGEKKANRRVQIMIRGGDWEQAQYKGEKREGLDILDRLNDAIMQTRCDFHPADLAL